MPLRWYVISRLRHIRLRHFIAIAAFHMPLAMPLLITIRFQLLMPLILSLPFTSHWLFSIAATIFADSCHAACTDMPCIALADYCFLFATLLIAATPAAIDLAFMPPLFDWLAAFAIADDAIFTYAAFTPPLIYWALI